MVKQDVDRIVPDGLAVAREKGLRHAFVDVTMSARSAAVAYSEPGRCDRTEVGMGRGAAGGTLPPSVLPPTRVLLPTRVLVGSLLLTLAMVSVGAPAVAQDPGTGAGTPRTPRGIDRVCDPPPDAAVPDPPEFTDLGSVHDDAILCAAAYGLVGGYGDGTYRPATSITRGQMASFLTAWLGTAIGPADLPEAPSSPRFDDAASSVHSDSIEVLAEVGIVGGRVDGSFGPSEPLSRGQFARAVVNAISYADAFTVDGSLPPPVVDAGSAFDDVAGTTFAEEIGALTNVGVAVGEGGSFHPDRQVTRGQLATFLLRAADYLAEYQRWAPTAETHAFVAELSPIDTGGAEDGSQQGEAFLWINAFEGVLTYNLDLSNVPGPYGLGFAAIHLGEPGQPRGEVIELADGATLDAKIAEAREQGNAAVVTGTVPESRSLLRFSELVEAPQQAFVVVATSADPNGAVAGGLRAVG